MSQKQTLFFPYKWTENLKPAFEVIKVQKVEQSTNSRMRTSDLVMQLIFFVLDYSFLLQLRGGNEGNQPVLPS